MQVRASLYVIEHSFVVCKPKLTHLNEKLYIDFENQKTSADRTPCPWPCSISIRLIRIKLKWTKLNYSCCYIKYKNIVMICSMYRLSYERRGDISFIARETISYFVLLINGLRDSLTGLFMNVPAFFAYQSYQNI